MSDIADNLLLLGPLILTPLLLGPLLSGLIPLCHPLRVPLAPGVSVAVVSLTQEINIHSLSNLYLVASDQLEDHLDTDSDFDICSIEVKTIFSEFH